MQDPIYAMFDGYAEVVTGYIQGMPYKEYDNTYGQNNKRNYNAGNKVKINSTVNGQKILQKNFHMDQVFITSGFVTAGTLIGTVGTTGSACSPKSNGPHLHLEIWVNEVNVNPETYLFTKFAPDGSKTRTCN